VPLYIICCDDVDDDDDAVSEIFYHFFSVVTLIGVAGQFKMAHNKQLEATVSRDANERHSAESAAAASVPRQWKRS
jgi:hypothetical protein